MRHFSQVLIRGTARVTLLALLAAFTTTVTTETAGAQIRGHVDVAHTHFFQRSMQSHIHIKGWLNENAWPRNCQSSPFGNPILHITIRAPGRAAQQFYTHPWWPHGYRPDVRSANLACTEWSGFEHLVVLRGVALYNPTSIEVRVWNTLENRWVLLPGRGLPTSYSTSNS